MVQLFTQADLNSKDSITKAIRGSHTIFLVTNYWETADPKVELTQGKNVADVAKTLGGKSWCAWGWTDNVEGICQEDFCIVWDIRSIQASQECTRLVFDNLSTVHPASTCDERLGRRTVARGISRHESTIIKHCHSFCNSLKELKNQRNFRRDNIKYLVLKSGFCNM